MNFGANTQTTVIDSNAAIVQFGSGATPNVATNTQTGLSDSNALILQGNDGGPTNYAANLQNGADGSNALVAQFGSGNVAANTQAHESSSVTAAIVQVGKNNTASNIQGGQETVTIGLPDGSQKLGEFKQFVVTGPVYEDRSAVEQRRTHGYG